MRVSFFTRQSILPAASRYRLNPFPVIISSSCLRVPGNNGARDTILPNFLVAVQKPFQMTSSANVRFRVADRYCSSLPGVNGFLEHRTFLWMRIPRLGRDVVWLLRLVRRFGIADRFCSSLPPRWTASWSITIPLRCVIIALGADSRGCCSSFACGMAALARCSGVGTSSVDVNSLPFRLLAHLLGIRASLFGMTPSPSSIAILTLLLPPSQILCVRQG
jgi:hypothetical protein